MSLKRCVGRFKPPPIYAKGTASNAKGQNKVHEKCPALKYCQAAIDATKILRVRAVGLITDGAKDNSDMIAI